MAAPGLQCQPQLAAEWPAPHPHHWPAPRRGSPATAGGENGRIQRSHSCLKNVFILIGEELFYNIVLVSARHQRESALGIHMSPPFTSLPPSAPFHPSRWSQFELPVSYSRFPMPIFLSWVKGFPILENPRIPSVWCHFSSVKHLWSTAFCEYDPS